MLQITEHFLGIAEFLYNVVKIHCSVILVENITSIAEHLSLKLSGSLEMGYFSFLILLVETSS